MIITAIDFDNAVRPTAKDNRKLRCPSCGEIWLEVEDGEVEIKYKTTCPHLKFIIEQNADEIDCLNGFTKDKLWQAVAQAYSKIKPDAEKMSGEEVLLEEGYTDELWTEVKLTEADTLLDFTLEYISHGPSSYTVYFGAKLL